MPYACMCMPYACICMPYACMPRPPVQPSLVKYGVCQVESRQVEPRVVVRQVFRRLARGRLARAASVHPLLLANLILVRLLEKLLELLDLELPRVGLLLAFTLSWRGLLRRTPAWPS